MKRFLIFALILCAFGCNSTKKVVQLGDGNFAVGAYIEATQSYVTALKIKPNDVVVRAKLAESAPLALLQFLARAQGEITNQAYLNAAKEFEQALSLQSALNLLGISLTPNSVFVDTQNFVYREATIQLRAKGQAAFAEKAYAMAQSYYQQILKFDPLQQEQVKTEVDSVAWYWSEDLTQQALAAEQNKTYKVAFELFEKAQEIGIGKQKDILENDLFRISNTLAIDAEEAQNYQESIKWYEEADRFALMEEKAEIKAALFRNYQIWADQVFSENKFQSALNLYESAQKYASREESEKIRLQMLSVHEAWVSDYLDKKAFQDALMVYERALRLANPTESGEIKEEMLQIMLREALFAMNEGQFKRAISKVEEALGFAPRHPDALALKSEIITTGTVQTLIMPMVAQGSLHSSVIVGWLAKLNEEANSENWRRNPFMVHILNPQEVKRSMQHNGLLNRYLQPQEVLTFARRKEVDVVLMTEVAGFELIDQKMDSTLTRLTNDKGITADIVETRIKAKGKINIAYQLLDANDGNVIFRNSFNVEAETIFNRIKLPLSISATSPLLNARQRRLAATEEETNARAILKDKLQANVLENWESVILRKLTDLIH